MMKYRDFYGIFIMGHSLTPYQNLQQKVKNGFCKLYFEAQTGYHPKEKNIIGSLFHS